MRDGHDVVVLSRRPEIRPWRVVGWDGVTPGDWQRDDRRRRRRSSISPGAASTVAITRRTAAEILQSRVSSTRVRRRPRLRRRRVRRACGSRRARRRFTRIATISRTTSVPGILGGDEPDAPDSWRFSIDVARALGAGVRRSGHGQHAEDRAPIRDDAESRSAAACSTRCSASVRRGLGGSGRPTDGSSCPGFTTRTSSPRSGWLIDPTTSTAS